MPSDNEKVEEVPQKKRKVKRVIVKVSKKGNSNTVRSKKSKIIQQET